MKAEQLDNKLGDITDTVNDYLFPSYERLMYNANKHLPGNHVIFKSAVLIGGIGTGKTVLATHLATVAKEKYGQDLKCYLSTSLTKLLQVLGKHSNLNVLYTDDITLRKISQQTLSKFWQSRHILKARTNSNWGLVVCMFGLHRFHAVPIPLRYDVDVLFFRSIPTNPYDVSVIRQYIGEQGLVLLNQWESEREDPESEAWNKQVVYMRGTVGIYTSSYPTEDEWIKIPSEEEGYEEGMKVIHDYLRRKLHPAFPIEMLGYDRRIGWFL